MKKLFLFLAVSLVVLSFTSCNKDEDVVIDEIVGTWENDTEVTINGQTFTSLWQWKFRADNTGDYAFTENGTLSESTTFSWAKVDSIYSIDYESEEMVDVSAYIESYLGMTMLSTTDEILGIKVE